MACLFINRLQLRRLVRHVADQWPYDPSNGVPTKINAIKMLREFTGLGLKESKDLIEAAYADMTPTSQLDVVLDAQGFGRDTTASISKGPVITHETS